VLANPTERFTGRVESDRRCRPGYPAQIVNQLRRECGLSSAAAVVDVAAGTGLLTEIFLAAGFAVTAVEPNDEMRAACAELERTYPKLRCVAGTAESTGLPDHSADLITVAQAMHWFDPERTRAEFARVVKPGGWCAVIYNNRRLGGDAFHDGYERLLREFGVDYLSVKEQHVGRKRLAEFFAPSEMHSAVFPNAQPLTLEALEGRILSSSYIPQPGHPRFAEMQAAMRQLFAENQRGGTVTIEYDCVVCWGVLAARADEPSAQRS
jgi:ubiquinone/menaquinone biosynthesis C-methylase UbiE